MIASEFGRGCRGVTAETRAPRVGVANAASTSREASCTPTSTPSSSHCTSPSMSCSVPGADRSATQAQRRRAGLPGGRPGPARVRLRAALAAVRRPQVGAAVPLPSDRLGLQPPAAPGHALGRPRPPGSGGADAELVGPAAAGRLHPGAMCHQPRDRRTLGPGRPCRLRLLQEPAPLLWGVPAVGAGRSGRAAGGLVPGHP
jgi:hypothetical protein